MDREDHPATRGTAASRLRIVLADDHAMVRAGLRRLLEDVPGWDVVAEAGDADAALGQVRDLQPEILLLDLAMPGRSSLDVLPQLRRDAPATRIVILTMEADPSMARHTLAAGAAGYVLKEAAETELVEAIRAVASGGSYLDPTLGAALAVAPARERGALDGVSDREREVLRLIALGNTNAEIAEALCLSVRTVESHRSHIQAKTGRSTRAQLVALALDGGLLDHHRRVRPRLAPR